MADFLDKLGGVVGDQVIKQGKKLLEDPKKTADGKPAAAAGTYTVEAGVKDESGLVAGIEKYMKDHGLKTKENGTLSGEELAAFKKHVAGLEKDSALSKGEITFGKDGKITLTKKALGLLEIEVPKGGNSVAGQVAGQVTGVVDEATQKAREAADGVTGAVGEAWSWFKGKASEPSAATDCGPPKDGDFGAAPPCPAKPAAPATGRSR